jgi:hypothetical protein
LKIGKVYATKEANQLLQTDELLKQAYDEVVQAICSVTWPKGASTFTANNSGKDVNGVVPLKEPCYVTLEDTFHWFREKPLHVLKHEKLKGGPIDVYKEFSNTDTTRCVGLEFETGNISSAHRSLNKLLLGVTRKELDLAIILMPMKQLAYHFTDRISNFEELEPYFENAEGKAFIFIGFEADAYSSEVPRIPKGKDGMSKRSIKKWEPSQK